MGFALDGSLVLYTLQTLKDEDDYSSSGASTSNDKKPANSISVLDSLETLCSQATSIADFINVAQRSPIHSIYVTSVEWRIAPSKHMSHEYVVVHVSSSPQAPPSASICIDRYGKLGVRERWWHLHPYRLTPNTIRSATSVLAGAMGDNIADPSCGGSILKYKYWTHTLPPTTNIFNLRRTVDAARRDACAALNQNVRQYVSNGLHLTQPKRGRRWADARGLDLVHIDIANALANAMDTGILRCVIQAFWVRVLPSWMMWSSVLRSVQLRREYSRVVETYRARLRDVVDSLPDLEPGARSKVKVSWGVEELPRPSPLLVQLLNKSLSNHAFISPHSPIATLGDVASRLSTIVPLLPESGITLSMCRLHAQTLTARFPDDLWHGYATPVPPIPVSIPLATWRRAKNSDLFWVWFDVIVQWLVYLALLPVEGVSGIWVVIVPMIHAWILIPWRLKEGKFWRRMWRIYDGNPVQSEGEAWDRDFDAYSLQNTKVSYGGRAAGAVLETGEIGLHLLRED